MKHLLKFDWQQDTKIDKYSFSIKIKIAEESKNLLKKILKSYDQRFDEIILPEEYFYARYNGGYARRYEFYIKDENGQVIKHLPLHNHQIALIIDDENVNSSLEYGIYNKTHIRWLIDLQNGSIEQLFSHNILKDQKKNLFERSDLEQPAKELCEQLIINRLIQTNELMQQPSDESSLQENLQLIEEDLENGKLLIFHLEEDQNLNTEKASMTIHPSEITYNAGIKNKTITLNPDQFFIVYEESSPYVYTTSNNLTSLDYFQKNTMLFILNLDPALNIENGFYMLDNQNVQDSYVNRINWNHQEDFLSTVHKELLEKEITYQYL